MSVIKGLLKTAKILRLPSSFHGAHLAIDARKYTPAYSKRKVSEMIKRRLR